MFRRIVRWFLTYEERHCTCRNHGYCNYCATYGTVHKLDDGTYGRGGRIVA